MSYVELLHGDCADVMALCLPDNSVDAIVTDPPYGLAFMGKRWDYDVPAVEVWAECLRVLKPGGHLLAFAGTRTQHRMAVRIEDAGFEIRDMIAWVYGSGFPKSLDVSKAIDKTGGSSVAWFGPWFRKWREDKGIPQKQVAALFPSKSGGLTGCVANWELGLNMPTPEQFNLIRDTFGLPFDSVEAVQREVIGQRTTGIGTGNGATPIMRDGNRDITAPATEAARQWHGWGTALKPALEPITVARKPLGTCATNVLQMVESQLRERGVRGEILWKPESASGAAKSKKATNSGSTRPLEPSGTSAKTADESVTQSVERQNLKSSEQLGTSGLKQTRDASESFQGCTTSGCANPSSVPMVGSARAAESVSETSSPSTTSTAEGPSTESKFMGRCTPNCDETASRPDTESFAGIATGLTGSMATVRISRDSEGFFLWPKGLPEFVPGSPLTVAENVLRHGTGALNIDGCRVELNGDYKCKANGRPSQTGLGDNYNPADANQPDTVGRWPANLVHDGSDEVLAAFPVTGPSKAAPRGSVQRYDPADEGAKRPKGGNEVRGIDDAGGSAARFFYCAKASKSDRGAGNNHPTVKPTELMRYLVRLVTPPGGLVLDPFMGSGSTGKAAVLEGFRFVGIDMTAEYVTIAKARIEAALMGDLV